MSTMASALAPHVPRLRRFGRALTGSQESGDAYVVATLETLVEKPDTLPSAMAERLGLFHVFLKIWNSLGINDVIDEAVNDGDSTAADRRIEQIQPLPRQAFLLTALEEFTVAEAATILGIEEPQVHSLVEQAGREIAEQVATDVMIIEDEPLIALDIEELVTSLGHRVTGIARTHREAISLAKAHKPGLVLADIHLADGSSGLDAVNDMLAEIDVPVIFITAYPERLLTGERPEPTFLITKPFQPGMVKAVVSQALFFERTAGKKAA